MTDSSPPAERSRGGPIRSARREWGTLILAVILAVAMGFLALGFFSDAVGPSRGGGSRIVQAVFAAICLVLLVVCARWARRVEHRLRIRSQEVARAYEARYTGSGPRPYVIGRGGRHYGPVTMGALMAACCVFVLSGIVGAVSEHAQAVRSSYVQHHGIAVPGTVGYVLNASSCSRSGCSYSAKILVVLDRPVRGVRMTTVHYPQTSSLRFEDRVTVLVDPRRPGYAEFPGVRFKSSSAWILWALVAVLFTVVGVVDGRKFLEVLSFRRLHRAEVTGSTA